MRIHGFSPLGAHSAQSVETRRHIWHDPGPKPGWNWAWAGPEPGQSWSLVWQGGGRSQAGAGQRPEPGQTGAWGLALVVWGHHGTGRLIMDDHSINELSQGWPPCQTRPQITTQHQEQPRTKVSIVPNLGHRHASLNAGLFKTYRLSMQFQPSLSFLLKFSLSTLFLTGGDMYTRQLRNWLIRIKSFQS